ncbi:hypothetical protein ACFFHH_15120 [Cytobacillus solani]|uniref:hypothetical protein n=1 Tax=Cytobacillus solani TaxID=1637975 RepID=UPI0006AB7972|nr:hypothetical protein [Cytobacillus solani]KOP81352.1 hypothetical protein AMS60_01900 [Bacillus sp. FJAT-21945]
MKDRQDVNEFRELADLLANVELDDKTSKDKIYNRLKFKMETGRIRPYDKKRDELDMKKKKWKSLTVSTVAVVCLLGAASTTSFAQGILETISERFQIGNLEIVRFDKEPEPPATNAASGQESEARMVELQERPNLTVQEARLALGLNFPAPTWLADYEYVNTVIQGENMVEVQYKQGMKTVNFLISQGGENGIGTTDEIKTETIMERTVYFANGIVIWEEQGFTVELYSSDDFDSTSLEKIISGFAVGKPTN